jgi:hypothetical protein
MRKMLTVGALGMLLLLGAVPPATDEPAPFRTLFCPECWTYVWGGGSLDLKGNCARCGRYPLELEVRRLSWWWCSNEHHWRKVPGKNGTGCVEEESLAVVVPRSEAVGVGYCPGHRTFRVCRLPVTGQEVCIACFRPAVRTFGSERAWHWCRINRLWASEPCSLNEAEGCCEKRSGMLLAHPDSGPIAR